MLQKINMLEDLIQHQFKLTISVTITIRENLILVKETVTETVNARKVLSVDKETDLNKFQDSQDLKKWQ